MLSRAASCLVFSRSSYRALGVLSCIEVPPRYYGSPADLWVGSGLHKCKTYKEAMEIVSREAKKGHSPDALAYDMLLHVAVKEGNQGTVRNLRGLIRHKQFEPGRVEWFQRIAKCRNDPFEAYLACTHAKEMLGRGMRLNKHASDSVIELCANNGLVPEVLELATLATTDSLSLRAGMWRKVLSRVGHDVPAIEHIMLCAIDAGVQPHEERQLCLYADASAVLKNHGEEGNRLRRTIKDAMAEKHVPGSVPIYRDLMKEEGDVEEAEKLVQEARSALGDVKEIESCYEEVKRNIHAQQCEQVADIEDLETAISRLKELHGEPLVLDSYRILLKGCAKRGSLASALEVQRMMDEDGIEFNKECFAMLIDSCGWAVSEALRLLGAMEAKGLVPDLEVYNAAIRVCGRGEDFDEAHRLEARMLAAGFERNIDTFNGLIQSWGSELSDVQKIVDEMESAGIEPNVETCNILINACNESGDTKRAKKWVRLLRQLTPDSETK